MQQQIIRISSGQCKKNAPPVIPGLTRNPEKRHCAWIPGQARDDKLGIFATYQTITKMVHDAYPCEFNGGYLSCLKRHDSYPAREQALEISAALLNG